LKHCVITPPWVQQCSSGTRNAVHQLGTLIHE
jgi:hypothetical protein